VHVTKPAKETQHQNSTNTQNRNTKQTKKQANNNNNNNNNNNRSSSISSSKLKGKFGSIARKIFNIFTTKDSYTGSATWNTESTAV